MTLPSPTTNTLNRASEHGRGAKHSQGGGGVTVGPSLPWNVSLARWHVAELQFWPLWRILWKPETAPQAAPPPQVCGESGGQSSHSAASTHTLLQEIAHRKWDIMVPSVALTRVRRFSAQSESQRRKFFFVPTLPTLRGRSLLSYSRKKS